MTTKNKAHGGRPVGPADLIAWRRDAGLTQAEAATAAGISPESVRRWEQGTIPQRPSWALPRYIAFLDDMLSGRGPDG